jgi:hypothetical protein
VDAVEYLHSVLHLAEKRCEVTPTFAAGWESKCRARLEELMTSVPKCLHDELELRAVVRCGDVAREIVALAKTEHVSTIVLNVRPRWNWFFPGRSLIERILRDAPCRVLLVRPPAPTAAAAALASAFSEA